MPEIYTPTAKRLTTVTVPLDGELARAVTVAGPSKDLADAILHLRKQTQRSAFLAALSGQWTAGGWGTARESSVRGRPVLMNLQAQVSHDLGQHWMSPGGGGLAYTATRCVATNGGFCLAGEQSFQTRVSTTGAPSFAIYATPVARTLPVDTATPAVLLASRPASGPSALVLSGSYAPTSADAGALRSVDDGATWVTIPSSAGLPATGRVGAVSPEGTFIIAGDNAAGHRVVYRSVNAGATWTLVASAQGASPGVQALAQGGTWSYVFWSSSLGAFVGYTTNNNAGVTGWVEWSTDGTTWTALNHDAVFATETRYGVLLVHRSDAAVHLGSAADLLTWESGSLVTRYVPYAGGDSYFGVYTGPAFDVAYKTSGVRTPILWIDDEAPV